VNTIPGPKFEHFYLVNEKEESINHDWEKKKQKVGHVGKIFQGPMI